MERTIMSEVISRSVPKVENEISLTENINKSWWKNEDWLAVVLGLFIIGLVLLGVQPGVPKFTWNDSHNLLSNILAIDNLLKIIIIGIVYLLISSFGIVLLGGNILRYIIAFPLVYTLAVIAQVIAGNSGVSYWGIEYVIFAVLIGLLISNTVGVPDWLTESVRTEFFIKTGLVVMGAGILIREILQAGILGIVQALAVVIVVWYTCFWIAKRLKLDDEFAVMLSTAVSICGVSAAIAACGAIKGDRKKLSYVTSLVLIVALPMIVLQPWIIKSLAIPDIVGGAWLGGTLDTTGSVVAASSLISEQALKAGTIVKFSQNVLIGFAAFALSIWWALRGKKQNLNEEKPSLKLIWERFPKFVLGFLTASLIFSFLLNTTLVKDTKSTLTNFRNVWFALAFVSIGLETRFIDFIRMEQGRPIVAFISAQIVNIIWTLIIATILFGGYLFAIPTFK
jgi:uncharacterized membrane protein YadS